jgi:murein DD-endopeptidase MepM/ murein hydrolase activator NlpD
MRLRVLPVFLAFAVVGGAAGPPLEVRPGGVVRWAAPGTELCSQSGRLWAPVDGVCHYPVDLEATGELVLERRREGTTETATVRVGRYPYPEQHLEVEDRMVHLAPEDEARAARERSELAPLWERETPPRFSLPLRPPLGTGTGGNFGSRRVFNGEPRSPHSGLDYRAAAGTPVLAVAPGRVVLVADHFFSGRSVFVDHGGGLISMSFHLRAVKVAEGQSVSAGQVLGEVGATGRATGPHLHFGLRWHGARVDPALLFGEQRAIPELP